MSEHNYQVLVELLRATDDWRFQLRTPKGKPCGYAGSGAPFNAAEAIESLQAENARLTSEVARLSASLRNATDAVCLLNSMVKAGEHHSEVSRSMVTVALSSPAALAKP